MSPIGPRAGMASGTDSQGRAGLRYSGDCGPAGADAEVMAALSGQASDSWRRRRGAHAGHPVRTGDRN